MLAGKRIRRWLMWAAAVVVIGGMAWACFPREPAFAQRARRVMTVDTEEPYELHGWGGYEWRNEHEVWLTHFGSEPEEGADNDRPVTLTAYDTTTHMAHPLADINRRQDVIKYRFRGWELSPDRRWLMLTDYNDINLLQIDGPITRHIPYVGRWDEFYLLGDSLHWISLRFDRNDSRHEFSMRTDGDGLATATPEARIWSLTSDRPGYTLANSAVRLLCGIKSQDRGAYGNVMMFLCTDSDFGVVSENQDRSSITIVRCPAIPADGSSTLTKVSLPQTGRIYDAAISPQCDRIACILRTLDTPPPVLGWLVAHLSVFHAAPRLVARLWVYDIKSKRWSEVAFLGSGPDQDDDEKRPIHLKWLPDGNRLSLIYKDALWTLPAH